MTIAKRHGPLDELAWDEYERQNDPAGWTEADIFALGAEWGAGWVFALVGMAEAIRARYECAFCRNDAAIEGMCTRCFYT